jgi:hypothetical protein
MDGGRSMSFADEIKLEFWWEDQEWGKYDPTSWMNNLALLALAWKARAKQIVEIGIGQQPNGVYILGTYAKTVGGLHYAIDVAGIPTHRARMLKEKYDLNRTEIIKADSAVVDPVPVFDLLYIDGGHDDVQVIADFNSFYPAMRARGTIVFDDYGKKHLGVTSGVDRIRDAHPELEFMRIMQYWMICRRRE